MSIKRLLQSIVFISIGLVLIAAAILGWSFQREIKAVEKNRIATDIIQAVFEQNIITGDYLLYPTERAELQWQQRYDSLTKILQQPEVKFESPEEVIIFQTIWQNHKSKQAIFARLVEINAANQTDLNEQQDLKGRLTSELWLKSQAILLDAFQLLNIGRAEVAAARALTHQVAIALFIFFTLIIVTILIIINRKVLNPINQLRYGAEQVGAGDLDFLIGNTNEDEIGQFGRAFDHMTQNLKKITVSRDELNQEIAERKHAEAALEQQTEDLARSNTELEQFAYVASHDLQEPLRAVASYLQFLERDYQDKLDERAKKFITHAVDGAKRMQTLIHDILAFSQVGSQGKAFSQINTLTALQQALANLSVAINQNEANITFDNLPIVNADESQLVQLFQNLIGNALKFRREQTPQIHITARRALATADHSSQAAWLFSVADNGIGFDPEFAERIFLIFQRLHTRQEYSGTGIGLAICKKIIERHHGRIWVESEEGKGTTFYFTIADGMQPSEKT